MQFVAGQRYRLRLINAGTTSGVTVTIPGALMVIVELDGVKVVPKKATSIGVLKPGQTVDIMINWEGGGDDQFLVALEDDHGDGTITQSFPIRVSGFISSDLMPPPHRYRDVLRLKPFK
jgi:FtsP/CotA-like multicopper oxidase with cupredoxin domain